MMTLTDIIIYVTAVITIWASPFIIAYAFSMIHKLEQKLPPAQRDALDYFAEKAVKHVEQTGTGKGMQKKNAAVSLIYAFFDTLKPPIPIPNYALIEAAIETVVWEINQSKIPDEFFDGDKRAINTGPIKPVQPPDPGGQSV
jgi:LL-H family phage holin